MSDEPNKVAEEELATSHAASAGENGTAAPQAEAEEPDNSEVVPVEKKALSRPALHGSDEEKAKKT